MFQFVATSVRSCLKPTATAASALHVGGYVFITNLLPLHVLVLMLLGKFDMKLYTAYTTWYILGLLLSMQIPFVGFLPLKTSEHMAALGMFGLSQIYAFVLFVQSRVTKQGAEAKLASADKDLRSLTALVAQSSALQSSAAWRGQRLRLCCPCRCQCCLSLPSWVMWRLSAAASTRSTTLVRGWEDRTQKHSPFRLISVLPRPAPRLRKDPHSNYRIGL